jgi:hypothetical protein
LTDARQAGCVDAEVSAALVDSQRRVPCGPRAHGEDMKFGMDRNLQGCSKFNLLLRRKCLHPDGPCTVGLISWHESVLEGLPESPLSARRSPTHTVNVEDGNCLDTLANFHCGAQDHCGFHADYSPSCAASQSDFAGQARACAEARVESQARRTLRVPILHWCIPHDESQSLSVTTLSWVRH